MNNLDKEISKYVDSKRSIWSDRTIPVVRSMLTALSVDWVNPYRNYKKLLKQGIGKYTIKTYFTVAGKFEEEVFETRKYKDFLKRNKSTFKNCYKDKTRLLKTEEYEKFLNMYLTTNHNMYNLLTLMGDAGLRVSEAINAKWEDILKLDNYFYLKIIGKGDKQRLVPLDVSRLIRKSKDQVGKIVGTVAFRFLFNRDLKPYTPHDFRAYYATLVANHPELNLKDASVLLGHNSVAVTSRYVRSDLNRIAKILHKV